MHVAPAGHIHLKTETSYHIDLSRLRQKQNQYRSTCMPRCRDKSSRGVSALLGFLLNLIVIPVAAVMSVVVLSSLSLSAQTITVSASPDRVSAGDTVAIKIETSGAEKPDAVILVPDEGVRPMSVTAEGSGVYLSRYILKKGDPEGLYAVQATVKGVDGSNAIGKATFLYKKIIGDFCIIGVFNPKDPEADMNNYIKQVKGFGANFLIVHAIITAKKVYYKSKICNTDSSSEVDQSYLGTMLNLADKTGMAVMISASWDMTHNIPSADRMKSTQQIIKELYSLYGSHPSVVGFYSWMEGSGIFYAPFVREFCGIVKDVNPGLLTACAPYMDNPLLASYLSAIRRLDIIIYQGMVMGSYRIDSRLKFPFRRVHDFATLASGACELQHKIVLTHMETFGYEENSLHHLYITGYNNIYQQILSAATVPGNNGLVMFTYSAVNYSLTRQHPEYASEFDSSRQAVFDGMKAFKLIGEASKYHNRIAVYLPYTDFHVFRWYLYYYNAFDAFRVMGIPVDILPYAPTRTDAYPPCFPSEENPKVLARLLKEKEVLVLPSISGVNVPDSRLIKHFVEDGGTVIAFGTKIPGGTTYKRVDLFGIEKTGGDKTHQGVLAGESLGGRVTNGHRWNIGSVKLPVWKAVKGKVVAEFDDGSPAIVVNSYGKGKAVSIMTDAMTAAEHYPDLIRALLDELGVQRYVDIIGTDKTSDIAVSKSEDGFTAAVVNHGKNTLEIRLKPLVGGQEPREWVDLVSKKVIEKSKGMEPLDITVKAGSYRLIRMKELTAK